MPQYDAQARRLAVDMVRSYERAGKTRAEAIRAARDHSGGMSESALRRWVKEADAAAVRERAATATSAAAAPAHAEKKHPLLRLWAAVVAVISFVGLLLTVVVDWRSEPVQAVVCPTLGRVAFLGLGDRACLPRYLLVTETEAVDLLNSYYSRKRNGSAELAYAAFAEDSKPGGLESYEQGLETTLISELLQAPVPLRPRDDIGDDAATGDARETLRARQDPNTFVVTVREYFLDGRVEPKRYHVRLQIQEDGEPAIVEERFHGREDGNLQVEYPIAYIPEPLATRRLPLLSSDVAYPRTREGGGHFRAMCEIEVLDDANAAVTPADVGWWTRTNQGWVRNVDLDTAGEPLGALPCSPYVLSRTTTS